ncbi:SLC5A7 [Mytilus coruscus]|uniref:SLC5A7 n=1 Tax=Mytilus coruscus TaxID=42192 RepID=A0A6J8C3A1_MYTCO|nr:SLC5A7 [Mytilus coruscus]
MAINVVGLVVLLLFYIVILVVGVVAARRKKMSTKVTAMESSIVAGRDLNTVVGIFTVTATTVGGGYINGTAESIATSGLVWTLAPFGIFIGLILGGLLFAKKMRDHNYLTMLDPCQEVYGNALVFMVYLASLCGDVFWTASILSALGGDASEIDSVFSRSVNPTSDNLYNDTIYEHNPVNQVDINSTLQLLIERVNSLENIIKYKDGIEKKLKAKLEELEKVIDDNKRQFELLKAEITPKIVKFESELKT